MQTVLPPLPPDGVSVGLVHMRDSLVSSIKVQIIVAFLLVNEFVEVGLKNADQLGELQMKLKCLIIIINNAGLEAGYNCNLRKHTHSLHGL